jgi:hypothetical protein
MTRDELYALVWEVPAIHAAKRVGVSSARLRKICLDYNIPLPPAGYWTKLAHGKPVEQPSLPQAAPTIFSKINSALRRMGEIPLRIADAQIDDYDLKFPLGMEVVAPAPRPGQLQPHAALLDQVLSETEPDHDGFLTSSDPRLPSVRIGPGSVGRTVRLLDAFVMALLQQRYAIVDHDAGFRIAVHDEFFDLKIYETRDRASDNPPPSDAGKHFRPSGKLCMEVFDSRPFRWSNRNLVGRWHDRLGRPVEDCFSEVIAAISAAAQLVRHCRARADEQTVIFNDTLARQREDDARQARARRRAGYLTEKSAAYAQYLDLVRFADFMATKVRPDGGAPVDTLYRELQALVAETGRTFEPAALDAEIRRLQLFDDDDLN